MSRRLDSFNPLEKDFYPCSTCGVVKPRRDFYEVKEPDESARPVSFSCRVCRPRPKPQVFGLATCDECGLMAFGKRKLCVNGICEECNARNGIKWCDTCGDVLPVDLAFYQNQAPDAMFAKILRSCKTCHLANFNKARKELARRRLEEFKKSNSEGVNGAVSELGDKQSKVPKT